MAHKIDNSKGFNAFVAYQQPAWHNLGQVFQKEITLDEALKQGGLDFNVHKLPNIHRLPSGIDVVSTDSFFTMRDDTNGILGTRLGKDYTVYQNHDALAVVDELLKAGKVRIETAGSIDEGRRVFVCMKLMEPIKVGNNDPVFLYILLVNSHDGTLAITAMATNVRVVCNNTLSAALAGAKAAHKIRHTRNAQDRVKEAMQIMGVMEDTKKKNEAVYNAMKCNVINKTEFFDYIGNIFMDEEEIKGLQKGNTEVLSSRKKNILEGVLEFADAGVGQREALDGGKLNMWYAYNAVTGYLTGKKYSSADDRFNSLLLGDGAKKMKTAGELALFPDRVQPIKQKRLNSFLN